MSRIRELLSTTKISIIWSIVGLLSAVLALIFADDIVLFIIADVFILLHFLALLEEFNMRRVGLVFSVFCAVMGLVVAGVGVSIPSAAMIVCGVALAVISGVASYWTIKKMKDQ